MGVGLRGFRVRGERVRSLEFESRVEKGLGGSGQEQPQGQGFGLEASISLVLK